MQEKLIIPLSQKRLPDSIGTKARHIRELQKRGYRVPETSVCLWDAYLAYLQDDATLLDRLLPELNHVIDPNRQYAIRSSANIEDREDFSFAGQFKSMLGMSGVNQIMQALWAIWSSTQSIGVNAYLGKSSLSDTGLKMAVIIQEMVNPVVSGVAFSKNPITSLDEIVVEAVHGSGELLMQEGVTPYRWVNKWGSWIDHPQMSEVPETLIAEIVEKTRQIARTFKRDVDLEWVFDGQHLYWVQMRDITSMKVGNIYSNRISKEMIPGLIKPLVWSVATPTHSALWIEILRDLVGENDINLSDMIHAFHYRAYFNVSIFGEVFNKVGMPRESLEMMMGLVPPNVDKPHFKPKPGMILQIPRLTQFLWNYAHFDRKAKAALPGIQADFQTWSQKDPSIAEEKSLLKDLEELQALYKRVVHFTIIVQLMMFIYNRMFRARLEKIGVDFQCFDLTEGMEELKNYDPNIDLANLNKVFHDLDLEAQESIRSAEYQEFLLLKNIDEFQTRVSEFTQKFGHLSESAVDFSYKPWKENPGFVLKLICEFQDCRAASAAKIGYSDLPPAARRSHLTKALYRRARIFRYYREAYSSLFTKSLGLLRSHYLALADQFVERGILENRDDIFYLYHSEVRSVVQHEIDAVETLSLVSRRKEEMQSCENISLPEVIFGDTPPPVIIKTTETLQGVPTSRGYYTGPVKVIRNLDDFYKLEAGDVLVIPFSDTSWLPLFTKAGAVIAESGGMLSHSSIIAREYNIPAVVSVAGALSLPDRVLVSVDGFKGEIQIIKE